jgi:hypothetical protein
MSRSSKTYCVFPAGASIQERQAAGRGLCGGGHAHLSFRDVFGNPEPSAIPRPLIKSYVGTDGLLSRRVVEWVVFPKVLWFRAAAIVWRDLAELLQSGMRGCSSAWLADVRRVFELSAHRSKADCARSKQGANKQAVLHPIPREFPRAGTARVIVETRADHDGSRRARRIGSGCGAE